MNAAEHLEKYLGPISRGWSPPSTPGLQCCIFNGQPDADVKTITTLGLSNVVLSMPADRRVRQELVFADRNTCDEDTVVRMLIALAEQMVSRGHALLRGEVVHARSSGFGSGSFYVSRPVLFPDEFATLNDTTPPTVFVWLFPLVGNEAEMVKELGWSKFEDRLELEGADLLDFNRAAVHL